MVELVLKLFGPPDLFDLPPERLDILGVDAQIVDGIDKRLPVFSVSGRPGIAFGIHTIGI